MREISTMLASQIEGVCRSLGLVGRIDQGAMTPRNPTRNDRNPGSFVIMVDGPRQGRWDEYATGDFGDTLDLVAYITMGRIDRATKREALIWAKRFLGIGDHTHMDPAHAAKLKAAREAMETATERAQAMAENNRDKDRRRAKAMFLEAKELVIPGPGEKGSPGWTYLREARGIPLERLDRLPWAVRWHPAMKHVETDTICPVLISALLFPDGSFGGVHRIFLEPGGRGKLKAALQGGFPTKKIWPRGWHGAFVPISRGRTGMGPREALAKGLTDECAWAEGVEDAFTVAVLTPEWRVSAVGASANFAHVDIPETAEAAIVIRDRDPDRKVRNGVSKKVAQLQAKAAERGIGFVESWPKRGFKDFNDMIRGVQG